MFQTTTPNPRKKAPMTTFINNDPIDADWSARFGFGNPRSTNGLQGICIHTTENDLGSPAEGVANYQINTETGSYHVLVDNTTNDNINSIRENTDDWLTWSAGWTGNQIAVHLSFVARASMSRADWLGATRMLNEAADACAYWVRKFNFPLVKLSPADLRAGKRGFFGHADVSAAWREVDHTDPGTNFPWNVFLNLVQQRLTDSKGDTDMSTSPKLERIFHELTHKFQSRYRTPSGQKSEYRDTIPGYVLNNDEKLTRLLDDIIPEMQTKLDRVLAALSEDKQ